MDRPEIILAPGPTPIPPEVLLAQGSPLVYHRGPGFGELMREVTARLRELYRTDIAEIFLLTSSGTGGLESAVQNLLSPGDEVFVPLAGFFSERWQRLATPTGSRCTRARTRGGRKLDPAALPRRARRPPERQGGAAHAVGDLDRRDPAGAGARRRRRVTSACLGRGRRGVEPRRGAVRVRRLGDRRRVGGSQKALSASPGSRSWP